MDEQTIKYLEQCLSKKENWVIELEEVAKKNHIPIMDPVSIEFLIHFIKMHKPKRILEIGTAIGYSALRMLEANPTAEIITMEKDEARFHQAITNINQLKKSENITVLLGDALEIIKELQIKNETFDFIFIDAAKGKYMEFFDLVHPMLTEGGNLITDNVLFRGYVVSPEHAPKRFKNMVKKINNYNSLLSNHPDYVTSILPIGDGVMISSKMN